MPTATNKSNALTKTQPLILIDFVLKVFFLALPRTKVFPVFLDWPAQSHDLNPVKDLG